MTRPVFNRPDTLLGVCEALGQDLGFNPLWLRIALSVGLLWNPLVIVAGYLMAGVAVLVARGLTPVVNEVVAVPGAPVQADNDEDEDGGRIMLAEAA